MSAIQEWAKAKLQEKYPLQKIIEADLDPNLMFINGCDTCGYGQEFEFSISGRDDIGSYLYHMFSMETYGGLPEIINEIISYE